MQHEVPQSLVLVSRRIPTPQEVLNPLILREAPGLIPHPPDLARRLLVGLLAQQQHSLSGGVRARSLADAAQRGQHADQADEGAVGHEDGAAARRRLLAARRALPLVPHLPVLPRRVRHRAVGPAARIPHPDHVGLAGPPRAVELVHSAFVRVGEDGVGRHDEAVTFETDGCGDGFAEGGMCGMVGSIGVVELYEFDEAGFGVGGAALVIEDLVG